MSRTEITKITRERLLTWGPVSFLAVFSLVAVAGYAIFGRDPSRLIGLSDSVAGFYAVSFGFFAQGQVILAGLVLAAWLVQKAGWKWLGAFAGIYGLSLGSELMGTAFGIPFGPYSYTDLLGIKWLDLVPVLIPLSWFFMAVPAYGLAQRALGTGSAAGRILLGSLLLLAWDLTLDPAMSEVTRYWIWGEPGPYYGMPLMNLFGWYVTGLVLMVVLEFTAARQWLPENSTGWLMTFYGANLVLPLGMTVAAGMWGAVVATAIVLGGVVMWAALRSRTPPGSQTDESSPAGAPEVEVAG